MVDFIVLGLPRSGTTWMANWLTTDRSLCLHDPFSHLYPEQLDAKRSDKTFGISCTGAYMIPSWLQWQDCPVVVIERDIKEVDEELKQIGLPPVSGSPEIAEYFAKAKGRRFKFEDIWNEVKAREMWAFLLPKIGFDRERYELLSAMHVQPHMDKWKPDMNIARNLISRGELCLG